MLPVTPEQRAGSSAAQSGKINVILETLALLFVVVFLFAMLLALTTAFQNGFW